MTKFYFENDLNSVYIQRKKILTIFLVMVAVYLIYCVAWLLFYFSLPYKDPKQNVVKAAVYVVSAIFVVFSFLFMGIKFSRVNKYYKMISDLSNGIKYKEENYFVCFAKHSLQKNSVDVVSCVFKTWNKKKKEWMEREIYIDCEKELPDFETGDYIRYITQANFLIGYDIIKKGNGTDVELPEAWEM